MTVEGKYKTRARCSHLKIHYVLTDPDYFSSSLSQANAIWLRLVRMAFLPHTANT